MEGKDFTVDDLVALLLERYDVDPEVARRDAQVLAKAWLEAGVVSE